MTLLEIFGKNLKLYRQQRNLSQEALASICGLHRTYISDIECFRRSISIDNISKIANALDIEAYQLFINHFEEEI